jgi:hypothetical protein
MQGVITKRASAWRLERRLTIRNTVLSLLVAPLGAVVVICPSPALAFLMVTSRPATHAPCSSARSRTGMRFPRPSKNDRMSANAIRRYSSRIRSAVRAFRASFSGHRTAATGEGAKVLGELGHPAGCPGHEPVTGGRRSSNDPLDRSSICPRVSPIDCSRRRESHRRPDAPDAYPRRRSSSRDSAA